METQEHDDEHIGKNEPRVTNFLSKTTSMFFVYNFLFYRSRELLRRCGASLQLPRLSVIA